MNAEKLTITLKLEEGPMTFEVIDFAHDDEHSCKFEVFLEDKFVAGLEPDRQGYLNICRNPGTIKEEILYQLAEKIEALNL